MAVTVILEIYFCMTQIDSPIEASACIVLALFGGMGWYNPNDSFNLIFSLPVVCAIVLLIFGVRKLILERKHSFLASATCQRMKERNHKLLQSIPQGLLMF
mmetsp:Transcript_35134/g.53876  ORF Transcript_35134/g.53876 Transcript_35134/m.53876 type:complete len:101 (+) Transcript_35134:125-427(+)